MTMIGRAISKTQQKSIKGGRGDAEETDIIYVQCGRGTSSAIAPWEVIPADGYYDEPYDACQFHCGRQGVLTCMNATQYNLGGVGAIGSGE